MEFYPFLPDHSVQRRRRKNLGVDAECGALNLSLLNDLHANQFNSFRAFRKSADHIFVIDDDLTHHHAL